MKNIFFFLSICCTLLFNNFLFGQATTYSPVNSNNISNPNFSSNLNNWSVSNNTWVQESQNSVFRRTSTGGRNPTVRETGALSQNLPNNIAVNGGYWHLEFKTKLYKSSGSVMLNVRIGNSRLIQITRGSTQDENLIELGSDVLLISPPATWNNTNNAIGLTTVRLKVPSSLVSGTLYFEGQSNNADNRIFIDDVNIVIPTLRFSSVADCDTCLFDLLTSSSGYIATPDVRPIAECRPNDAQPYKYTYYMPAVAEMPEAINNNDSVINSSLQITSESKNAIVKIIRPDGVTESIFQVNAGSSVDYPTPFSEMNPDAYNVKFDNKGYILESDQPITVRWVADHRNNRLAVVVRNNDALGKVFRTASVNNTRGVLRNTSGQVLDGYHYITVMATENNTKVKIANHNSAYLKDDFKTYYLDKYDQVTVIDSGTSVSGRLVMADKLISVVSGQQHKRIAVGNGNYPSTSQEGTVIQVKPIYALSKEYLIVRAGNVNSQVRGGYQVVAVENNTDVTVNNTVVAKLNAGEIYQVLERIASNSVGTGLRIVTSKPAYVYDLGANDIGEFELYNAPALDLPLGKSSKVIVDVNQGNFGWVVINEADQAKLKRNNSNIAGTVSNSIRQSTLNRPGLPSLKIYYFDNNFTDSSTAKTVYSCEDCNMMYVGQMADGATAGAQVGYVSSFDGAPLQFFNTQLLPTELLTNGYLLDTLNYFVSNPNTLSHSLTLASSSGNIVKIDSIVLSRTGGRNPGSVASFNGLSFTLNTPPTNTVSRGAADVVNATIYVSEQGQAAAVCLSYVLMNFNPLPVDLLSFDAKKKGITTDINWVTANERDNKGFFVQRSKDGRNWENLAWVDAKSLNSIADLKYEYNLIDTKPFNGKNYYRLQQNDFNGKTELSEVRIVEFDGLENTIAIYPNPTSGLVYVEGLDKGDELLLYTATGQLLQSANVVEGKNTLDLSKYAVGVYLIQVNKLDGSVHYERIVKN